MKKTQMDKTFASFIRRRGEPTSTKTFFAVLAEIERERSERTIELKAKVIGGKLHFEPSPKITVQDNQILMGTQRIVVTMS